MAVNNMDTAVAREAAYLMGCALHGIAPEPWEGDLEALFDFCRFHQVTAMVAVALEERWKVCPGDENQMKPWSQAKNLAIRKNILLGDERQKLLQHLDSLGCWHMSLKGSLLQFDYPKFGMRQMSDSDILCDGAFRSQIRRYMESAGYQTVRFGESGHDEYAKEPVFYFEIHTELFEAYQDPELAAYYEDLRHRLRPGQGKWEYRFSRDDFYIYLTAHAYKHRIHSGIGLRSLSDTWVYLQKYGSQMDWAYTEGELRKLGAWEFHLESRGLAEKLFHRPDRNVALTEAEQESFAFFASSGAHGTMAQKVGARLKREGEAGMSSRLRYLLGRLFPPAQGIYALYPLIARHKWLLPFGYAARLVRACTTRRQAVGRELRALEEQKNK